MFWRKRSKRERWAMQSLLERLAAVDEGGPLLHAHHGSARQVETGRKRRRVPFFFAGLVCAALAGVLILTIVSFMNGSAPEDRAPYALTTTASDPSVEPPNERRLLWWKFPHRIAPTEKRRGSSGK